MIHPKISRWLSRYKLLLWTYVAPSGEGPWGDYSNNISVNDIGLDLNNLVVEHEGPIGPLSGGILGQTAGSFGIVEPVHYLESNMFLGRAFLYRGPTWNNIRATSIRAYGSISLEWNGHAGDGHGPYAAAADLCCAELFG